MKSLQEHISTDVNEHVGHRIFAKQDRFKMFDYIRNKINNDDIFIEMICRSLVDSNAFTDVMYDIADNQHINIPNNF